MNAAKRLTYQEQGFLVLPGLLTADEVTVWRATIDAAVRHRASSPPTGRLGVLDRDERPNELFLQHVNLWQTDLGMRSLVLDPWLAEIFAELEQLTSVQLCFDSLLIKRPFSAASRFHLDLPHWSLGTIRAGTIWIALDAVDPRSGCMCYLPGTHTARRTEPGKRGGFRELFERYPDWAEIEPVFCAMAPGDAVVHHALIAHGSTANMQPRRRRAMTIALADGSANFNGRRSPLFAVDGLDPGDPFPDAEHPTLLPQPAAPAAQTGAF